MAVLEAMNKDFGLCRTWSRSMWGTQVTPDIF